MSTWLIKLFVHDYRKTADPMVRSAYGQLAGAVGIVCNILLCLAKGAIGMASGSVSIVADAINNLSDAASNIVSLLGFKLAERPADAGHPYGHGRFEYLAGLVTSVLVVAVGVELSRSGLARILHPEPVEFSLPLLAIMLMSIGMKAWMMGFNQLVARRIDAEALEAVAMDSRNDAITTFGVLTCALISQGTGVQLDGWVGLALGLFVLVSGIGLVRDTVSPLLGQAPSPELVEHIRNRVLSRPCVLDMHELRVHDYGPGRRFATAHVVMPAEMDPIEAHRILNGIEREFLAEDHLEMTLHWDPVRTAVGGWDGTDPDTGERMAS